MKPLVAIAALAGAEERGAAIEWPDVGEIKIVWQWEPNERPLEEYGTQPFPTRPPPFSRQGVSLEDANDLTPEIHALAVAEMRRFRIGPLFTPPSLRGTLQRPVGAAVRRHCDGPRDGRRSRGIRAVPVVEYVPIASGRRGCVSTIHAIEKAADLTGARSLDLTGQASRREWQDRETQDVG